MSAKKINHTEYNTVQQIKIKTDKYRKNQLKKYKMVPVEVG